MGAISHQVCIASPEGQILEEFAMPHDEEGFRHFFRRVEHHRKGGPVAVAMEGYGGHARPLDGRILSRGRALFNVNNLKLARFREIFSAPAKSDRRDAWLISTLLALKEKHPAARGVLAPVVEVPEVNRQLKRLTRRRRELVREKVRVTCRLTCDLRSVCPELLSITGSVENLWFLRFLCSRPDLASLARMRPESILKIPGVGKAYAQAIRSWQRGATFSEEVSCVSPMISSDAARLLKLKEEISLLEARMGELLPRSAEASLLSTIPGFSLISACELAGEIGSFSRFSGEASLALFLGMCPLDHQSGSYRGTRVPRQVNKRAKGAMMAASWHNSRMVPLQFRARPKPSIFSARPWVAPNE